MKQVILIILAVFAVSGCAMMQKLTGMEDVESARIIYSEAGGAFSVVTGRSSSCAIVKSPDENLCIAELTYDAATGECSGKIVACDNEDTENEN